MTSCVETLRFWSVVAQRQVSKVVLDTSVLIAVLRNEQSDVSLAPVIEGASMSTVNPAEIYSYLQEHDPRYLETLPELLTLVRSIDPFTESQAKLAGMPWPRTRSAGLSLGDRACLALAIQQDADAYTADRAWMKVDLPCRIHLIP